MLSFEELQSRGGVIVSLPRLQNRYEITKVRLEAAGFQGLTMFKGVDGFNDDMTSLLKKYELEDRLSLEIADQKGKVGCTLSHILTWQKIVDEKLPYLLIFEDDALPHPEFRDLAPLWWAETPAEFDVVLLGNQMNPDDARVKRQTKIVKSPSFCLHAYIVTYKGAVKLLELLKVTTVMQMNDLQMRDWMITDSVDYYCWNGTFLPDKGHPTFKYKRGMDVESVIQANPVMISERRDTGLVYRDFMLQHTLLRPTPFYNVVLYDD